MEKTSLGLEENIAGLLCYVLWWVSGIAIFLLETENKLVRFHAMQSIVTFGAATVALIVLGWIPVVGIFFSSVIWAIAVIAWIVLMVRTYQGVKIKIPWAGDFAEKRVEQ